MVFERVRAHGLWRSLVSALDWGSRGREFKSPQPDGKRAGHEGCQLSWHPLFCPLANPVLIRGLVTCRIGGLRAGEPCQARRVADAREPAEAGRDVELRALPRPWS